MPAGRPRLYDYEKIEAHIQANPTHTYSEIAQEFGCSIPTAQNLYCHVFPDQAPPATRRRMRREAEDAKQKQARREKRAQRRQAVLKAAEENPTATYQELAESLGEKLYLVSRTLSGAGLGPGQGHRRGGGTIEPDSLADPKSERAQIIEKSLRENWTLKETGEALGVTRERARQLRKVFKERFPLPDLVNYLTVHDIAQEIGAGDLQLRKLARERNIGRPRGYSQRIFTEEEAKQLQQEYMLSIRKTCAKCGATFFRAAAGGRYPQTSNRYCSRECQVNFHNHRYINGTGNTPTPETTTVWSRLVAALDSNRPPETEFVSAKQAKMLTGASTMQLTYLRYRGIIRTQDHPTRKRNGTPHKLYSLSDIQTLKQCMPNK